MQQTQSLQNDQLFTQRLGSGYSQWISEGLVPYLASNVRKLSLGAGYTNEEIQEHALRVSTQYALDEVAGDHPLKGFIPQTADEVLRVREFVAMKARNELLRKHGTIAPEHGGPRPLTFG